MNKNGEKGSPWRIPRSGSKQVMQICLLCACALTESFGDDLRRSNIPDKVGPCA